ncbi:Uu.00g127350.m01.CDS01 [Anthostomella pinea]|uniref:Uu.00g127350.m01.CDS01 n=1 Tax=Anthostomella pinea TaxID=933095 RepID=A0AAI8YHW5_9PEZI|nr:Uu.00g127350.m01.CDS01 [Anthostomella pinea]
MSSSSISQRTCALHKGPLSACVEQHNASTGTSPAATDFPQFSKLAAELRVRIWKENFNAKPEPRINVFHDAAPGQQPDTDSKHKGQIQHNENDPSKPLPALKYTPLYAATNMPGHTAGAAQANSEARAEAKKMALQPYAQLLLEEAVRDDAELELLAGDHRPDAQAAVDGALRPKATVDWDRDLIYMAATRDLPRHLRQAGWRKKVQRLAITVPEDAAYLRGLPTDPGGDAMFSRQLQCCLRCMPALREVYIVFPAEPTEASLGSSSCPAPAAVATLERDAWGFVDYRGFLRAAAGGTTPLGKNDSFVYCGIAGVIGKDDEWARPGYEEREFWTDTQLYTVKRVVDVERRAAPTGEFWRKQNPVRKSRSESEESKESVEGGGLVPPL